MRSWGFGSGLSFVQIAGGKLQPCCMQQLGFSVPTTVIHNRMQNEVTAHLIHSQQTQSCGCHRARRQCAVGHPRCICVQQGNGRDLCGCFTTHQVGFCRKIYRSLQFASGQAQCHLCTCTSGPSAQERIFIYCDRFVKISCTCRRSADQQYMTLAGPDAKGLAQCLPVPAINNAAGVLEATLERRLFPLRSAPRPDTCMPHAP